MEDQQELGINFFFEEEQLPLPFDKASFQEKFELKPEDAFEMKDLMNENPLPDTKNPEFYKCQVEDEWYLDSILSSRAPLLEEKNMDMLV